MLCDKFLKKDDRNFHVWNYRSEIFKFVEKYYLPEFQKFVGSELEMTLKMIKANTSNFSAWHYRSKLLPIYFGMEGIDWRSEFAFKYFANDLDYLKHAIFTDPKDQSPWNYHYWLLNNLIPLHLKNYSVSLVEDKWRICLNFSEQIFFEKLALIEGSSYEILEPSNKLSNRVTLILPADFEEISIQPNISPAGQEAVCFSIVNVWFDKIIACRKNESNVVVCVELKMKEIEDKLLEGQLELISELISLNEGVYYEHAMLRKAEILELLYNRVFINDKNSEQANEYKKQIIEIYETLRSTSKRMKMMYTELLENFK